MNARVSSITKDLRTVEKMLNQATSYQTWQQYAAEHDRLSGADRWKQEEQSDQFDARLIKRSLSNLRAFKKEGNNTEALFALNEGIHGNMGGIGKAELYQQAKTGTKVLINDYVSAIQDALYQVYEAPDSEIDFEDKLDFFRRASHCYGRSALSLSGGAGLIYYHHGVVESLLEQKLLPNIISGASAGSWMAAQIGTRTDEELKGYFLNKRYAFGASVGLTDKLAMYLAIRRPEVEQHRNELIDTFVEDMTFQEAYEHSGRYINISVAPVVRHQSSRLLNALTSPNVTIRSAVKASSALPGTIAPAALEAKDSQGMVKPYLPSMRWYDGSFAQDLPLKRLSRLFGVNHHIVSMINPLAKHFLRASPKTGSDSVSKSMRMVSLLAFKEYLKTVRRIVSPTKLGRLDSVLGLLYQIVDQDYAGDINLILDLRDVKERYAYFGYNDDDEVVNLIRAGQRATWAKLDQIRNATEIGLTIDQIIERLESDSVSRSHKTHLSHLTR